MDDRIRQLPNGIPVVPVETDGIPVVGDIQSGGIVEEKDPIWQREKGNYYKKDETYSKNGVDERLALKADMDNVYSKEETYSRAGIDTGLSKKADKASVYTKEEVDASQAAQDIRIKALEDGGGTPIDTYTKAEIDEQQAKQDENIANLSEVKADKMTVYTRTAVDNRVNELRGLIDTNTNDIANRYTKSEVDASQKVQDDRIKKLEDSGVPPADTYTKEEIDQQQQAQDTEIAKKANIGDSYKKDETYSKAGVDERLLLKADVTALDTKANSADVYNKTDIDSKVDTINESIDSNYNDLFSTKVENKDFIVYKESQVTELGKKANAADIYNKTQIDEQQATQDTKITELQKRLTVAPLAVANIGPEDINGDEEVILALDGTKFYANNGVFTNEQLFINNTDISDPANNIIIKGMISVTASEDTGVGTISVKCTGELNGFELKETIDLKANQNKLIPFEYLLAGDTAKIELKIAATEFASMKQLKVNNSYVSFSKVK